MMRRLLIQALVWEVWRARTKLGIAMAASKPMMATTIMISTSVKPDLRFVLSVFICIFYNVAEQSGRRVIYDNIFVHLIACCNRVVDGKACVMPTLIRLIKTAKM